MGHRGQLGTPTRLVRRADLKPKQAQSDAQLMASAMRAAERAARREGITGRSDLEDRTRPQRRPSAPCAGAPGAAGTDDR